MESRDEQERTGGSRGTLRVAVYSSQVSHRDGYPLTSPQSRTNLIQSVFLASIVTALLSYVRDVYPTSDQLSGRQSIGQAVVNLRLSIFSFILLPRVRLRPQLYPALRQAPHRVHQPLRLRRRTMARAAEYRRSAAAPQGAAQGAAQCGAEVGWRVGVGGLGYGVRVGAAGAWGRDFRHGRYGSGRRCAVRWRAYRDSRRLPRSNSYERGTGTRPEFSGTRSSRTASGTSLDSYERFSNYEGAPYHTCESITSRYLRHYLHHWHSIHIHKAPFDSVMIERSPIRNRGKISNSATFPWMRLAEKTSTVCIGNHLRK